MIGVTIEKIQNNEYGWICPECLRSNVIVDIDKEIVVCKDCWEEFFVKQEGDK